MERQSLGPSGSNPVAEEQFRKGFELARSGNIEEGILAVEAAIAVSPDEGRYHDLMGTLYAKKGLYEMAVAEWKRSIECDPDHAEVFRRIETANKMKAQLVPRGDRWARMALGGLSILLVASLAWGIFQGREQNALETAIAEKDAALASVEQNYVSKADHQTVLDMAEELSGKLAAIEKDLDARNKEIANLKDQSKFVPIENYEKERELRNQVASDLKLARDEVNRLNLQLQAVGNATGAVDLTQKIALKDQELTELSNNYKRLNDDRVKLEKDLVTARDRVKGLEGQVDDLKAQFVQSGTATVPIASVSSESFLAPILEGTLRAVVSLQEGNSAAALASLKGLEEKHPNTPGLKEAIAAISPPTEAAPTATPTPASVAATPVPTKAPTARPTATKAPVVRATATPVSKPAGPVSPAKPRPLGGAAPQNVAEKPKEVTRPQAAPTPVAANQDDQAKRLQQQKAAFTQQAYQAYRNRDFPRAKQLVDRAYRIDSKDPAVNQLRGAIEKAMNQ